MQGPAPLTRSGASPPSAQLRAPGMRTSNPAARQNSGLDGSAPTAASARSQRRWHRRSAWAWPWSGRPPRSTGSGWHRGSGCRAPTTMRREPPNRGGWAVRTHQPHGPSAQVGGARDGDQVAISPALPQRITRGIRVPRAVLGPDQRGVGKALGYRILIGRDRGGHADRRRHLRRASEPQHRMRLPVQAVPSDHHDPLSKVSIRADPCKFPVCTAL
jgi:hypothetical protein